MSAYGLPPNFLEMPEYRKAADIVAAYRQKQATLNGVAQVAPLHRAMVRQLKDTMTRAEAAYYAKQEAEQKVAATSAELDYLDAEIEALVEALSDEAGDTVLEPATPPDHFTKAEIHKIVHRLGEQQHVAPQDNRRTP